MITVAIGDTEQVDGVEIVQLLCSPLHRYAGRPGDGAPPVPEGELVEAITLRAGLGIVGDRYFGKPAHRDASVTMMAAENLPSGADLVQTRRNILLRGLDVDALIGSTLVLDSGDGPVTLRLNRPAHPCAWMNVVIGPGAMKALRGRGGARATPLSDGVLRVGPLTAHVLPASP